MATSIEERILDLLATALQGISGGSYEQTVAKVSRASQSPPVMEYASNERPGLQIRHIETAMVPHLRGALECRMDLEIICIVDQDAADEKISDLIGDVCKVLKANERWDAGGGVYLARRTWITNSGKHETESPEDEVTGFISFSILFRVDATNLAAVKEI